MSKAREQALAYADEIERAVLSVAPDLKRRVRVRLGKRLERVPLWGTQEDRIEWLASLVEWFAARPSFEIEDSDLHGGPSMLNLWLFTSALAEAPACKAAVQSIVRSVVSEASALSLFAEVGLPEERGVLGEAIRRLTHPLIPEAPQEGQLAYVVHRLFGHVRAAKWLDGVAPALFEQALVVLTDPDRDGLWAGVRRDMADAIDVLSTRTAALGLVAEVRVRGSAGPVQASPFMQAARIGLETAEALRAGEPTGPAAREAKDRLRAVLADCRNEVGVVLEHLDAYGVSVDLVYRLEQIERSMSRIERIMDVLVPPDLEEDRPALRLLSGLVRDDLRDRSIVELMRTNVRQLARKVIERAGETGEHYITSSRGEYFRMVLSAMGGGVLTAGTTLVKFLLAVVAFPIFFSGLFASLNYAISFVIMQLLGFTLATKQPSMTAATLAGSLGSIHGRRDYAGLIDEIAKVARSQLAAVIGNLGAAIPVSIGIDLLWRIFTGHGLLTMDKAEYVVASLHPFTSGTIFFAALTGIFLWLSSLLAGSLENWAVYRRLPEAIQRHRRVRWWLGEKSAKRMGSFFAHHVSGFGGNVSLGFLLGMCWTVGSFFGLPLDVRHVTLSTSSLTFAASTIGADALLAPPFLFAALGIVIIGALNFGVSFVLALAVALRAREVNRRDMWLVARLLMRRFVEEPLPFFFPRAAPPPSERSPGAGRSPSDAVTG